VPWLFWEAVWGCLAAAVVAAVAAAVAGCALVLLNGITGRIAAKGAARGQVEAARCEAERVEGRVLPPLPQAAIVGAAGEAVAPSVGHLFEKHDHPHFKMNQVR